MKQQHSFDGKEDRGVLVLNMSVAVLCTATQTALATVMSYITSSSLMTFTLYTGVYLASMGLSVGITDLWARHRRFGLAALFVNALLAVWLAQPGVGGLAVVYEMARSSGSLSGLGPSVWFLLGLVLCALLGLISGAELPFYSRWIQEQGRHDSRRMTRFLASDYAGAFTGVVLFALIGNPFIGWMRTLLCLQAAAMGVIGGCAALLLKGWGRRLVFWVWGVSLVLIAILWVLTRLYFARHHGVVLL